MHGHVHLRRQAAFLQKLNSVDPEAVLRRVESKQYATNEAVTKEYREDSTYLHTSCGFL
jgi:hypothetical protein